MAEIYDEKVELERFDALVLRGIALGFKSSRRLSQLLNIEADAVRARLVALIEAGYVNGYTFKLTEMGANTLDQATLDKISVIKMEPNSILAKSWIMVIFDNLVESVTHGIGFCIGAGIVLGLVGVIAILAMGYIL